MADEPVPITPTRCPVKSTPSWGQRPVWYVAPSNESRPGKSGRLADDRQPVAMTTNRAVQLVAARRCGRVHRSVASSNVADSTRVSNRMSRRRSNRSATWLRVAEDLGLGGVALGPVPLLLELVGELVASTPCSRRRSGRRGSGSSTRCRRRRRRPRSTRADQAEPADPWSMYMPANPAPTITTSTSRSSRHVIPPLGHTRPYPDLGLRSPSVGQYFVGVGWPEVRHRRGSATTSTGTRRSSRTPSRRCTSSTRCAPSRSGPTARRRSGHPRSSSRRSWARAEAAGEVPSAPRHSSAGRATSGPPGDPPGARRRHRAARYEAYFADRLQPRHRAFGEITPGVRAAARERLRAHPLDPPGRPRSSS